MWVMVAAGLARGSPAILCLSHIPPSHLTGQTEAFPGQIGLAVQLDSGPGTPPRGRHPGSLIILHLKYLKVRDLRKPHLISEVA